MDGALILKRRKAIALRIAEAIERKWPNLNMEGYDVDEAAILIDQYIPLTAVEADAEFDAAPNA